MSRNEMKSLLDRPRQNGPSLLNTSAVQLEMLVTTTVTTIILVTIIATSFVTISTIITFTTFSCSVSLNTAEGFLQLSLLPESRRCSDLALKRVRV